MPNTSQDILCSHCQVEVIGNYCSQCGRPVKLERISGQYIISEISNVLNLKKGILLTTKELLLRPGISIRTFISEDRNRLVKPIIFLILCSLIYSIIESLLGFEKGIVEYEGVQDSTAVQIFSWVQSNYGYANMIMAIFIAFWMKIMFRKYTYNFFELLIVLCYAMGVAMMIYALVGVVENLSSWNILEAGSILGIAYSSWLIGSFYDKTKKWNYVKAFFSYLLGMLTFSVTLVGLGSLIDIYIK